MDKLKNEYMQAFLFIKRIKWIFAIIAVLFVVIAIAAHFITSYVFEQKPDLVKETFDSLEKMIDDKKILDNEGNITAIGLFFNNLIASVFSAVIGAVPFLFLPAFTLILNSAILGVLSAIMGQSGIAATGHEVLSTLLVSIVPHGIFEIPALLLMISGGLLFCREITFALFSRNKRPLLETIGEIARVAVLVSVPLLAVAAVIEAYITPVLMYILLK